MDKEAFLTKYEEYRQSVDDARNYALDMLKCLEKPPNNRINQFTCAACLITSNHGAVMMSGEKIIATICVTCNNMLVPTVSNQDFNHDIFNYHNDIMQDQFKRFRIICAAGMRANIFQGMPASGFITSCLCCRYMGCHKQFKVNMIVFDVCQKCINDITSITNDIIKYATIILFTISDINHYIRRIFVRMIRYKPAKKD